MTVSAVQRYDRVVYCQREKYVIKLKYYLEAISKYYL